jgi:CRISPR-associated protein Cas5h
MRQTLISFDLKGDFGVFKKPDVNEGLQLTFNMLHKPALLGILGAISGLKGYERQGVFPEYYQKFRDLRVGIEPLESRHDKGNFVKTVVKYTNTVGYANADGNLIVTEQTLRRPGYRVYLLLDLEQEEQARLYERIRAGEAEYLPYFGKNECAAWWEPDSVREYAHETFVAQADFSVSSIFVREGSVQDQRVQKSRVSFSLQQVDNTPTFALFERLPTHFFVGDSSENNQQELFSESDSYASSRTKPLKFVQYDLAEFAFTNWTLRKDSEVSGLVRIRFEDHEARVIQLF